MFFFPSSPSDYTAEHKNGVPFSIKSQCTQSYGNRIRLENEFCQIRLKNDLRNVSPSIPLEIDIFSNGNCRYFSSPIYKKPFVIAFMPKMYHYKLWLNTHTHTHTIIRLSVGQLKYANFMHLLKTLKMYRNRLPPVHEYSCIAAEQNW